MKIGVIFDMDGVLIDSEEFYFTRRLDYLKSCGVEPSSREITDYVGQTESLIWQKLIAEDTILREELYAGYHEYQKRYPIDYLSALNPGVEDVLRKLKEADYPLALASSSKSEELSRMLKETKLATYFDFVISGHQLPESKPHPEIYLRSFEALACYRAVAVEDSATGIQSAKEAGLYTFAVKQDVEVDQHLADRVIANLVELPELIAQLKF